MRALLLATLLLLTACSKDPETASVSYPVSDQYDDYYQSLYCDDFGLTRQACDNSFFGFFMDELEAYYGVPSTTWDVCVDPNVNCTNRHILEDLARNNM